MQDRKRKTQEPDLSERIEKWLFDTQTDRDKEARDVLNFLLSRAYPEAVDELLSAGAVNPLLFRPQDERELLELWLEERTRLTVEENRRCTLEDLRHAARVRGKKWDVDELISVESFGIANARQCAESLKKLGALNRQLIFTKKTAQRLEAVTDGGTWGLDYIQDLEQTLQQGNARQVYSQTALKSAMLAAWQENVDFKKFFIRSGFETFDRTFLGFRRGELSVIAGRPGDGKTMLALNCVEQLLNLDEQARILVFSLEMPAPDLLRRLMVSNAHPRRPDAFIEQSSTVLTFNTIRDTNPVALQSRDDAINNFCRIADGRLVIQDQDPMSIDEIETEIQLQMYSFKPDIVVIDYWQLITGGHGQNVREKLVNISQRLKSLAKRHQIAILVLAQLRRQQANGDEIIHPDLSSIADSDQLGRDAALVACVSSMRADDGTGHPYRFYGIEVVKNRHGMKGLLRMDMRGAVGRFYELELAEAWPTPYREPKKKAPASPSTQIPFNPKPKRQLFGLRDGDGL